MEEIATHRKIKLCQTFKLHTERAFSSLGINPKPFLLCDNSAIPHKMAPACRGFLFIYSFPLKDADWYSHPSFRWVRIQTWNLLIHPPCKLMCHRIFTQHLCEDNICMQERQFSISLCHLSCFRSYARQDGMHLLCKNSPTPCIFVSFVRAAAWVLTLPGL